MKAVEEEISIRQEMHLSIEKVRVHHADSSNRCKRMKFCDGERKQGQHWQERKEETARVRTQEPLKETFRRRTQATLKVEAIRWKGGEFKKKRKEEKWKKKKKKKNENESSS